MKVNKELVWKLWRLNGGNVQKVILAYEKSKQENDDPLGNNQLTVERVQNYSIIYSLFFDWLYFLLFKILY